MDTLKIHNERLARKAGDQSPIENVQYMISEARLDEAGDAVTVRQVMQDDPDATLIYRLPPAATIGPILSIRAFDFES